MQFLSKIVFLKKCHEKVQKEALHQKKVRQKKNRVSLQLRKRHLIHLQGILHQRHQIEICHRRQEWWKGLQIRIVDLIRFFCRPKLDIVAKRIWLFLVQLIKIRFIPILVLVYFCTFLHKFATFFLFLLSILCFWSPFVD